MSSPSHSSPPSGSSSSSSDSGSASSSSSVLSSIASGMFSLARATIGVVKTVIVGSPSAAASSDAGRSSSSQRPITQSHSDSSADSKISSSDELPSISSASDLFTERSTERLPARMNEPAIPFDAPEITGDRLDIANAKFISSGGFGAVLKCRYRPANGEPIDVALKVIDLSEVGEADKHRVKREIGALWRLRHCPHVIQLVGHVRPGTFNVNDFDRWLNHPRDIALFAMQLGSSSLFNLLKPSANSPRSAEWPLWLQLHILVPIAEGLHHAHTLSPNPIFHRDLKPGNIVFDLGPGLKARVADFGLAKFQTELSTRTGVLFGTEGYICPELTRNPAIRYQAHHDVYSFGFLMWCVATRQCKLPKVEGNQPDIPSSVDSRIRDLIRRCWNWANRPAMEAILQELKAIQQTVADQHDPNHELLINWPAAQSGPSSSSPKRSATVKPELLINAAQKSERLRAVQKEIDQFIADLEALEIKSKDHEKKGIERCIESVQKGTTVKNPPTTKAVSTSSTGKSVSITELKEIEAFVVGRFAPVRRSMEKCRIDVRNQRPLIMNVSVELDNMMQRVLTLNQANFDDGADVMEIEQVSNSIQQSSVRADDVLQASQSAVDSSVITQFTQQLNSIFEQLVLEYPMEIYRTPVQVRTIPRDDRVLFLSPTSQRPKVLIYHVKPVCTRMVDGNPVHLTDNDIAELLEIGSNEQLGMQRGKRMCKHCLNKFIGKHSMVASPNVGNSNRNLDEDFDNANE